MPISKIYKYAKWLESGILHQSFIDELDPLWVRDNVCFLIRVEQEPEVFEEVEFWCLGGSCDLYTFIRGIASDLFFMGNSFIRVSKDKEQIQDITRDIIESSMELGKDVRATSLLSNDKILHLRVGQIDKEGFGTSILEPASDQIEGFFNIGEYIAGRKPISIPEMYKWDKDVAKTIAEVLGFTIDDRSRATSPAGFFDSFLVEVEQLCNNDLLNWLNSTLNTNIQSPLVTIIRT